MGKRTLQAVKTVHPCVHPIAYTDDTYLIEPPEDMTGAFHTLIQAGTNIRLHPSLHKCHVYGTPGTAAFNAACTIAQTLHIPMPSEASSPSKSRTTPTPLPRWASHTLLFASNCAYPSEKVVLT